MKLLLLSKSSLEGAAKHDHCITPCSQKADGVEEFKEMIHDAVSCHSRTGDRPRLTRLHQVTEELMAV